MYAGQLEAAVRNNNVPSNLTPKLSAAYGDKPEIYDNGYTEQLEKSGLLKELWGAVPDSR